MVRDREDVELIFRMWLDLSSDQVILWLLVLVEERLRRSGYAVRSEVQPPPGRRKE